ncbi:hypothetical protein AMS68_007395 [Peltaster fructicola]|uniref:Uncharacterized protein n=1 Tax=Peltaster fructicola TaxID=286661 RepID=A0A6H0Y4V9_9PEZI|nr:hypothetical protein AMS68_007395 [Peltaster fructicola]
MEDWTSRKACVSLTLTKPADFDQKERQMRRTARRLRRLRASQGRGYRVLPKSVAEQQDRRDGDEDETAGDDASLTSTGQSEVPPVGTTMRSLSAIADQDQATIDALILGESPPGRDSMVTAGDPQRSAPRSVTALYTDSFKRPTAEEPTIFDCDYPPDKGKKRGLETDTTSDQPRKSAKLQKTSQEMAASAAADITSGTTRDTIMSEESTSHLLSGAPESSIPHYGSNIESEVPNTGPDHEDDEAVISGGDTTDGDEALEREEQLKSESEEE